MNYKLFKKFYVYSPYEIQKIISNIVIKKDGGEPYSCILRKLWEDLYGIKIGMGSYGCFFNRNIQGLKEVENYCSFGPNIYRFEANHPIEFASMSPVFYNSSFGYKVRDVKRTKLVVGNDVWIGGNVTILSNCTKIGDGAVIGAGSVVTKNIEPYSIVVGVPAREIRKRFDVKTIEKLQKSKWWENNPNELIKGYKYISSPADFAEFISKLEK